MRREILVAAAAAAAAVLADVTLGFLLARGPAIVRVRFASGEPAGEDDLFSETQAQRFERRLRAVEEHLQQLPPERIM